MQTRKVFKRAYLHIGLGKTGSSSIQRQLLENADFLEREHDIHFPRTFSPSERFDGNHSLFLAAMFLDRGGMSRAQMMAGFKTPEDIAPYAADIRSQFESGFSASGASRLLISAEGVGHFSRPRLLQLASWLRQFAQEIEIVACLRHPIEALSSEIQQRLRQGFVLEELYETPPYYKFRNLFDRIDKAFPDSGLSIYDFSEAVANPRGLVGALLEQVGISVDLPVPASRFTNPSMSHEAALLLSALNRARPLVVNKAPNKRRSPRDVMEFLRIPGRKFQAPREVYERVEGLVADELQWLEANYGLQLRARPVTHELDYKHFSDESIEAVALRIATLSRIRYSGTEPFRSFIAWCRTVWGHIRRRVL